MVVCHGIDSFKRKCHLGFKYSENLWVINHRNLRTKNQWKELCENFSSVYSFGQVNSKVVIQNAYLEQALWCVHVYMH